jgi:hypothetical protein
VGVVVQVMRDSVESPADVGRRWSAARRIAGYAAALSMSFYLVVKVVWIAAALIGRAPDGFATADWALPNAFTVVMAVTGVGLGLALAQRWGRRLPAVPMVFFSWVGAGFLVPMIPYMVIKGVLGALGPTRAVGVTAPVRRRGGRRPSSPSVSAEWPSGSPSPCRSICGSDGRAPSSAGWRVDGDPATGGFTTVEYPQVAAAEHAVGIGAGLTLLALALRVARTGGPALSLRAYGPPSGSV